MPPCTVQSLESIKCGFALLEPLRSHLTMWSEGAGRNCVVQCAIVTEFRLLP